jgi:hypothetical protein
MLNRRVLLSVLCLASSLSAQTTRRRKPKLEPKPSEPPGPKPQYPQFTDAEIRVIREFYSPASGNPPPGLAKRDTLPPGLRKQLHRRGTLPPGLDDKLHDFPEDLARKVPPPPKGYRHGIVGGTVLLFEEATSLIVDTIDLAVR